MGCERGAQANAVPLFLGFPFATHWLRPYQGRATLAHANGTHLAVASPLLFLPIMKLYCVYTPAHEILFKDWFLPSIPDGFNVVATPLQISGAGDFLSEEFLRCIRAKVALMVESIQSNRGSWILWSDIDILFNQTTLEVVNRIIGNAGNRDIFFQSESRTQGDVNTGFILIHCGDLTETFFRNVGMRLDLETGKNEQIIENEMLRNGVDLEWDYLPISFVARTHGWPPSRRMAIYHANYTMGPKGVEQKIRQFKAVKAMQRYGWPAIVYFTLTRCVEKSLDLIRR